MDEYSKDVERCENTPDMFDKIENLRNFGNLSREDNYYFYIYDIKWHNIEDQEYGDMGPDYEQMEDLPKGYSIEFDANKLDEIVWDWLYYNLLDGYRYSDNPNRLGHTINKNELFYEAVNGFIYDFIQKQTWFTFDSYQWMRCEGNFE
jgi:hypothetical protein